jgi:hypothetical protein
MNKDIEIYDNIIDDKTIDIIKQIIKQPNFENMTAMSNIRNPVIDRTKDIECKIGLFIHELLTQLNDNTKYIEYWIHTDSKGIGFHRDCDDELLSSNNILLIPEKAHILYLDNKIYCPTMILNNNNILLSPNVSGRLTRFNGDLYHSVGIPGVNFNNITKIQKYNRNVILFNTWTEENYNLSTFNKTSSKFKYVNIDKIEYNNISLWKNIIPIINDSSLYDYKLLFKFLREKRARTTENYTNYFNNTQIEKGIIEFALSSDIIEHYNNRILTPIVIKYLFN